MAVRRRSIGDRHADDARYNELRQRLVAAWREEPTPEPVPDILEETDHRQRVIHVFVTWDEWAGMDAQMRSEMIVDALQEVRGAGAVSELTIAMGLTTAESARLGRSA